MKRWELTTLLFRCLSNNFHIKKSKCFFFIRGKTSGGSRKFWWGGFEAQNLKNSDVFTKIESDFSAEIGNSNVFFAQIQVVSKKKKKKGLHQNWDWFFAGLVTFRSVGGGMHPEMEPNYSKQRLIFLPKSLLLGWWGDASPHPPPPKSATGHNQKLANRGLDRTAINLFCVLQMVVWSEALWGKRDHRNAAYWYRKKMQTNKMLSNAFIFALNIDKRSASE